MYEVVDQLYFEDDREAVVFEGSYLECAEFLLVNGSFGYKIQKKWLHLV